MVASQYHRSDIALIAIGVALFLLTPVFGLLFHMPIAAIGSIIAAPTIIGLGVGRWHGRPAAGAIIGLGFWFVIIPVLFVLEPLVLFLLGR